MSKLSYQARQNLPAKSFAIPAQRKYPIEDQSHARNALARVAQNGTPSEIAKVKAAVRRKFPNMQVS